VSGAKRKTCPTCSGSGTVEVTDVDAAAVAAWAKWRGDEVRGFVCAVKEVRDVTRCSLNDAKCAVQRAKFPLLEAPGE
jgi:ribosomal protein L7/L12